ncbi:hypothetical protein Vretimale_2265 [Volvox reticuliferus]|uniref:Uncharacterized protein n=1 Tax=Volvox reticuliferus TaxID=1737510 RepID=A0A8J4C760_9CHLO|nr:hypothetical protein Vretifemale_4470 [Volvox reticuliferus]GIL96407.1 hypothetical protein Vretimale_2265 [Volvox reticuliferus]
MPPKGRRARQTVSRMTRATGKWRDVTLKIANGTEIFTQTEMTAFGDAFLPSTAGSAFLVVDEHAAVGMFTLFGLCLRRSRAASFPGVDEAARSWYHNMRKILALNLFEALSEYVSGSSFGRHRLLLVLMLRTDVMACYAALLLAKRSIIKHQPSRRNIEIATDVCIEVVELVWALAMARIKMVGIKTLHFHPITTEMDRLQNKLVCTGLLDAWATCCLQLLAVEERSRSQASTQLMRRFSELVTFFPEVLEDVGPPSRPALGALAFLLTAHVVRIVSLYDSGTSYGLHDTSVMDFPKWDGCGVTAGSSHRDTHITERLLNAALG